MNRNASLFLFLSEVALVLGEFILFGLAIWTVNQDRKYHPRKVLMLRYALQQQHKPRGTSQ